MDPLIIMSFVEMKSEICEFYVPIEFSQIANIKPKPTTYWHKRGMVNNFEMSCVSKYQYIPLHLRSQTCE